MPESITRPQPLHAVAGDDHETEHVLLLATVVNGTDREQAWGRLQTRIHIDGRHLESYWVAEDDRLDGSDNDSAVFCKQGSQAMASRLLLASGLANPTTEFTRAENLNPWQLKRNLVRMLVEHLEANGEADWPTGHPGDSTNLARVLHLGAGVPDSPDSPDSPVSASSPVSPGSAEDPVSTGLDDLGPGELTRAVVFAAFTNEHSILDAELLPVLALLAGAASPDPAWVAEAREAVARALAEFNQGGGN